MVRYTLPQNPDIIIDVSGKDSAKAREKAMDQLMDLIESDQLGTHLAEGFSPGQFVEVKELDAAEGEDDVVQAIQILSNLANLKLKVQESRTEALQIRAQIDLLFQDEDVSEEELTQLKEGFKTLKNFAQVNLRFREAREKAREAREKLDRALQSPEDPLPRPK